MARRGAGGAAGSATEGGGAPILTSRCVSRARSAVRGPPAQWHGCRPPPQASATSSASRCSPPPWLRAPWAPTSSAAPSCSGQADPRPARPPAGSALVRVHRRPPVSRDRVSEGFHGEGHVHTHKDPCAHCPSWRNPIVTIRGASDARTHSCVCVCAALDLAKRSRTVRQMTRKNVSNMP